MADVVRHPSFPAEEIERQRASRLASLVQQRENPNAVAAAVMAAALYGPAHPYGYTELGTEPSNKAMTRDDMQKFWSQNFVPNNAALIVSGADHGRRSCGRWSRRRSATGRRGTPPQPTLGAPATTSARLVLVDKPGAPQTQLRVASIGVPRATPDYEADPGHERGARRSVLEPHQPQPARSSTATPTVRARSSCSADAPGPFLVGTGVRTDVTGAGGLRDHEGAQAHARQRRWRPRS